MIFDWLANRESLFSGESSLRIYVFSVRREKGADVPTEGKEKRKEIAPKTKAPTKTSPNEKLR